MKRLEGKVAIITGGARGMGEAHARLFVEHGAKVIITDVLEDEGVALAESLGDNAIFIKHDVTSEEGWMRIVETTEKHFGNITVLVNNAGIAGKFANVADLDFNEYKKVMAVNSDGVFLGMKSVIPSMLKAGQGSIVNISSVSGLQVAPGSPNAAYVGSKFAVTGLTKMAALEYATRNIRVNSVHPGGVKTGIVDPKLFDDPKILEPTPLGRLATPIEVAYVSLFLASDESSYLTAAEYKVDGGMTAK
ncbi:glucose 1-dehydrogenase [Flavobacterium piscis]|uniref:3alpha(Or 20beta)-hydroxysteroid dehydrogenase n=1 Tax=Flavobacterium piscis TaxID=1114874 RepID=A0ABU1Y9A6_9FLAO|nr:glucose 1-dehydrogenase [Flavobacterium piscis]MDR7210220.1 3alpha(or 20beta)-hydroxysteroid dehydrogenase [Flavobacterium piscis]